MQTDVFDLNGWVVIRCAVRVRSGTGAQERGIHIPQRFTLLPLAHDPLRVQGGDRVPEPPSDSCKQSSKQQVGHNGFKDIAESAVEARLRNPMFYQFAGYGG